MRTGSSTHCAPRRDRSWAAGAFPEPSEYGPKLSLVQRFCRTVPGDMSSVLTTVTPLTFGLWGKRAWCGVSILKLFCMRTMYVKSLTYHGRNGRRVVDDFGEGFRCYNHAIPAFMGYVWSACIMLDGGVDRIRCRCRSCGFGG
jgi:hypothetical protein